MWKFAKLASCEKVVLELNGIAVEAAVARIWRRFKIFMVLHHTKKGPVSRALFQNFEKLVGARHLGHFGGKIVVGFFDAFTQLHAHEGFQDEG